MKVCKTCGLAKPEDQFPPRIANGQKQRPDGSLHRRAHCRACYKPQRSDGAVRRQRQRYYERHKEAIKAQVAAYRATPEGRTVSRRGNLKARYGLAVGHSEEDWRRLLLRYDGKCFYCSASATERDHIFPLSQGGTDYIGNILPSCRDCNNRKDKKLLVEFRYQRR